MMAFMFYDYDRDGSIGSVDILNIVKHLDAQKMKQINEKYEQLASQKRDIQTARKDGYLKEALLLNKKLVRANELVITALDSDDDEEVISNGCHLKESRINDQWNMVLFEV